MVTEEIKKVFAEFGKKGGLKTKKRGRKYYSEIGKKGGLARKKKISTSKPVVTRGRKSKV